MKLLRILKDGRQLESLVLHRPVHMIGRAPSCDLVLRAKGIRPVHMIVEWMGATSFNPEQGDWTIFEISENNLEAPSLGVILSSEPTKFAGLEFRIEDAKLDVSPRIGGRLKAALLSGKNPSVGGSAGDDGHVTCLEVLELHRNSGSVERIQHFKSVNASESFSPIQHLPEIRLQWKKFQNKASVNVSLPQGQKNFRIFQSSREVPNTAQIQVRDGEIVRLENKESTIFFRFVESAVIVPIKHVFFRDKTFGVMVLGLFVPLCAFWAAMAYLRPSTPELEVTEEPARVVRIENPTPPPPPPVAPVMPDEPQRPSVEDAVPKQDAASGSSVAHSKPTTKKTPNLALSKPAPVKNVTQVGILGILNQSAPGPGVRPDKIVAQDLMGDTPSSSNPKVVLKSSPTGTIGTGDGGSPNGNSKNLLNSASTKLSGGAYDPSKTGPLVSAGTGTGNALGSLGNGKSDVPGFSVGSLNRVSVQGGLDRETVRRIVRAQQGQIQTCYERALVNNAKLEGRFVLEWKITPAGPVSTIRLLRGSVPAAQFTSCLLQVIKSTEFPAAANGQPTGVVYPFEFKSVGT